MNGLESKGAASRAVSKLVFVFVLMFVFAVAANAYTVVMRGGRRVEIPSRFVVTSSTLTYEVSPGVQVTMAVAAIDITATEKANNEQPGSLLQRIQLGQPKSPTVAGSGTPTRQATRTITNRDLESSMLRRRESESAYESRRKQLGLPSLEESRRQAVAEADSIRVELEQTRVVKQESENYWRERATALRTELATIDAELTYVRSRLDEGPSFLNDDYCFGGAGVTYSTYGSLIGGLPFGNFDRRQMGAVRGRPISSARVSSPRIFVAPRGGTTRGQVFANPLRPAWPRGVGGSTVFSGGVVLGASAPGYDLLYERSALITRFNELGAARARLSARWRELEEEARRAGVAPGWLRP